MTQKLYYQDAYTLEFETPAAPLIERDGRRGVMLEATYFYPTSGGQPHDLGRLGAARVVDVTDEEEGVVHWLEGDPGPGPWKATIDAARRADHRQQHTGQHVLSQAFVRALRAPTVSFHLGPATSTIDVELRDPARVGEAEELANRIVAEGREVRCYEVTPEEIEGLGLRKPPAARGRIRIVDVVDFDRSACGGTHVARTSEIQLIKILGTERVREQCRVEFVCGERALRDYAVKHETLKRLGARFTTGALQVEAIVEKKLEEATSLRRLSERLEQELARHEGRRLAAESTRPAVGAAPGVRRSGDGPGVKPAGDGPGVKPAGEAPGVAPAGHGPGVAPADDGPGVRLVAHWIEDRGPGYLRALAAALQGEEGLVFLLGLAAQPPAWIAGHGPGVTLDLREFWKGWAGEFGARGGGKSDLLQGGGLSAGVEPAAALAEGERRLRSLLGDKA